jgi:prevent-host-death family protein
MEAGIRDLRNHLSQYLERVRSGEEIVVTDRGEAVARLVPLDRPRVLDRLIAEGLVEPAPSRIRSRPRRRGSSRGLVSELVGQQRE